MTHKRTNVGLSPTVCNHHEALIMLASCFYFSQSHEVEEFLDISLCKTATIHQVTTMLATSKNVLFPGHSHLLTTGADDPTL